MTKMEILLIVCAVLIPIVALIRILPKMKKKEKSAKQEKPKEEPARQIQQEEKKPDSAKKIKTESKQQLFDQNSSYSADDFKDYLKEKNKKINKPVRKELSKEYKDLTKGYEEYMRQSTKPEKSMADDICCLSPELQAMVLTGILNRKF